MQKFSIKELTRIETVIDEEISFVESRLRNELRDSKQASVSAATEYAGKVIDSTVTKRSALLAAKFAIRAIKQVFNTEKGINDKTRKIAELQAQKDFVDKLAIQDVAKEVTNYTTKTVKYRPGITLETQDKFRAESRSLQRQIQRLKDSCQGINNQGTIELDSETRSTLLASGIVDA